MLEMYVEWFLKGFFIAVGFKAYEALLGILNILSNKILK